jgi:hypothetical protein
MVTDEYCYVHNLLSGTVDFRYSNSNDPLPKTPLVEQDMQAIKDLTQAYYETARYMMLNNLKRNATTGN